MASGETATVAAAAATSADGEMMLAGGCQTEESVKITVKISSSFS